jgi:spermidine/putrescine ABC transporter ATP-binding subunit
MAHRTVLELKNITKRFDRVTAVDNLTISSINRGEFVTFLGPSGCGKTTLLRMIAGFYNPTFGSIIMNGEKINDIPPEKRMTSMVFQNYALFPHMSVFGNIAYGLKLRKLSKSEIRERVSNILKVVQLEGLEYRKSTELSGGQQQRVALARCIVIEPEIILLDEPLSNLDANLRVQMREEIRKIQQTLNLTTIFVTHDQEEAMSMSDRIVVMNDGRVEQIGTPTEIYEKPATLFVSNFIGYINLMSGQITSKDRDRFRISTAACELVNINSELKELHAGDQITVIIRPESVALGKSPPDGRENLLTGVVLNATYIGSTVRYTIDVPGMESAFIVDVSNPEGRGIFKGGEEIVINLPKKFHCIKN